MLTAARSVPSFSQGYARNVTQAMHPALWRKALGFWCPSVGRQARVLKDLSGNGYHGLPTTLGNAKWQTGPNGIAINYTTGEFWDFGDINNLMESQSRFSLVTWMKRNASGSFIAIGKGTDSALTKHIGIDLDATTVRFNLTDSADAWGKYAINDLSWHCYGFSFDGSQSGNAARLKGYVDGRPVALTFTGTIPAATLGATSGVFRIGRILINSVTTNTDGSIGDTFAYTRALTDREHALFAQGYSPLTKRRSGALRKHKPDYNIAVIAAHYARMRSD